MTTSQDECPLSVNQLNTGTKDVGLILTVSLLILLPSTGIFEPEDLTVEPCNGSSENCDKAYTDVTFPETHNAHASLDENFTFLSANHRQNLSQQWDAGFRAFMLDIHHSRYSDSLENTSFCHGSYDLGIHPCVTGSQNAIDLLSILHQKMNTSERDVVTLLFEVYVPYSHIAYILNMTGLMDKTHIQTLGEPWPTLESMVGSQHTLVVFIEGGFDSDYPYLHNFVEHGWTTNYAERNVEDMTCDVHRGDSSQPVWHMNNWLALDNGLTDYTRAPIVNAYDFLLNRSLDCWEVHGSRPTFVAVDWWTDGEAVNVTRTLNQMNHWSDEVPLRATTDSR
ncbi:MAG: hypothetical protein MKZ56_07300 [Candidatus Thalassarchaeum sp.]|nr:hypothetical protein [Candidatus Thalassarchaeum sp.]